MLLRALQHVSFSMGATTRSSILGTVENVARGVLLVLLVPAVGIIGVPVSIALAALLVAPAVVRLARRRLGELPASPGTAGRVAGFAALLSVSAALSALLVRDGWWAWLAACSVVALLLAATLVLMLPEVKSELVARRRRNAWR
jgi:peptidoglycan biosynthesis protein MviN/MurJ (putative lipid II flippase)